jgi:hypothetical protein
MIPPPSISFGYFDYQGKQLFGMHVDKSPVTIQVEGQHYLRQNDQTINLSAPQPSNEVVTFPRFETLRTLLQQQKQPATDAKKRLLDHYLNILKLCRTFYCSCIHLPG